MSKEIDVFLKACLNLGKELLNKENLSAAEKNFMIHLDKVGEIIEKNI